MNLKTLEFILSRFADASVFGEEEREALKCARDIVAALRAANDLPAAFNIKDLVSLIWHKCQLPERPQAIVRLPSSDDSQYDRFTVLPAGLSLASAIAAANEAIQQANKEDHDSEDGQANRSRPSTRPSCHAMRTNGSKSSNQRATTGSTGRKCPTSGTPAPTITTTRSMA